jgi:two-component system NtrC family response regulator
MAKLLIVDDEERILLLLKQLFADAGHSVATALTGEEALHLAGEQRPDVVLLDLRLPGMDGLYVLGKLKTVVSKAEVIIMTAFASVENAVEAMKAGAADYIMKPFNMDDMFLTVNRALERISLREENLRLKAELAGVRGTDEVIGRSTLIQEAVREMMKAAPLEINVLLRGESGTGKTLFARLIHKHSPRCNGPFVEVNCASFTETILENELFGHEKEAFTGAEGRKKGKVELADGGTLFLDEVADMSPTLQAKVLKVVENRSFFRVGGEKEVHVDCRFLFATNADIEARVAEGTFRSDLYFRVNVFSVNLPPLRRLIKDIPLLVEHILRQMGAKDTRVSPEAMETLLSYAWPGNIRELENVVQSALVRSKGKEIATADLPSYVAWGLSDLKKGSEAKVLEAAEERMVRNALKHAGGNKSRASALLGITRKRLYRLMRTYNIRSEVKDK